MVYRILNPCGTLNPSFLRPRDEVEVSDSLGLSFSDEKDLFWAL